MGSGVGEVMSQSSGVREVTQRSDVPRQWCWRGDTKE